MIKFSQFLVEFLNEGGKFDWSPKIIIDKNKEQLTITPTGNHIGDNNTSNKEYKVTGNGIADDTLFVSYSMIDNSTDKTKKSKILTPKNNMTINELLYRFRGCSGKHKNVGSVIQLMKDSKDVNVILHNLKRTQRYFIETKDGDVIFVDDGQFYRLNVSFDEYKSTNFSDMTVKDVLNLTTFDKNLNLQYKRWDVQNMSDPDESPEVRKQHIRDLNWQKKEDQIKNNLNKIFADKNIKIVQGKNEFNPNGEYVAYTPKSGTDSDIQIYKTIGGKKQDLFFIETKLCYESGGFFKFRTELEINGKGKSTLKHTENNRHRDDQKEYMQIIFDNKDANFFLGLQERGDVKTQIAQFIENLYTFLSETNKRITELPDDGLLKPMLDRVFNKEINKQIKKNKDDEEDLKKNIKTKDNLVTDLTLSGKIFPKNLVEVVESFQIYLDFVTALFDKNKRKNKNNNNDNDKDSLYSTITSNIQTLFKKKYGDKSLQEFINDYKKYKNKPKREIFSFIYNNIMSSVKNKHNTDYIKRLFRCEMDKSHSKYIADAINNYYTNVHNARYIEIGITDFSKGKKVFGKDNWQSNIFVLNPEDNDKRTKQVPKDPFNLEKTYHNSVHNISSLYECTFEVNCEVENSMDTFNFEVRIATQPGGKGKNTKLLSFEDIKEIKMEHDLPIVDKPSEENDKEEENEKVKKVSKV